MGAWNSLWSGNKCCTLWEVLSFGSPEPGACGFVAHDLAALTVHWKAFIMVFDTLFLPLSFWSLLRKRKKRS